MQIIFHSRFPVINTSDVRKHFLTKLLLALAEKKQDHRFVVVSPDFKLEEDLIPNNIEWIKRPSFSERSQLLELAWTRIQLPKIIKKTNATLFMTTDGEFVNQLNIPQIIFSHNYRLFNINHYKSKKLISSISKGINKTDDNTCLLFTPSTFHLDLFLKTAADQIKNLSVLYSASLISSNLVDELNREKVKSLLTQGCEYFICSSDEHAKENILVLLRAFSRFKKRLKSNMKLVIFGKISGFNKKFQEELGAYRFRNEVLLYEGVTHQDELIASAYAGIFFNPLQQNPQPIIDSLYVEVPTISTDQALHKEIAGDAGLFFQEINDADLAVQMMMIYKDEDLRSRLIHAAQNRKNVFSMREAVNKMENAMMSFAQNE